MVLEAAEALLAGGDAEPEGVRVEEAAGVDRVQAVRRVGPVGADVAAAAALWGKKQSSNLAAGM